MEKTDKSAEDLIDLFWNNLPEEDRRYSIVLIAEVAKSYATQQISEYKEVIKELLPIVKSFDYKGFNAYQEIIDRAKKLIEK